AAHAGTFGDGRTRTRRPGVHGVRRAELLGEAELPLVQIDGDDRVRAREHRTLDDVEPDAARAEDRDRLPGLHARGVDDRADAGHHAAADQAGAVERHVGRDRDAGVLRHDGELRHRADAGELADAGPVAVEDLGGHRLHVARLAEVGVARVAVPARAAERHPVEDHVVLRLDAPDAGADRLDDARALVPEHAGERHGEVAGDGVQVAVADAARGEPDEHLAVARVAHGERLDRERLADRVQDGGSGGRHGAPPRGWRTITAAAPPGARGPTVQV